MNLALLAMLVQIAVQAWHDPLMSAATIERDGDVPLIAICTGGGIKWIPITAMFGDAADDLGSDPSSPADQEETPPGSKPFFCQICASLSLATLLAVVIGLAWRAPARHVGVDRNAAPRLSSLSIHATAPRGPPIPA